MKSTVQQTINLGEKYRARRLDEFFGNDLAKAQVRGAIKSPSNETLIIVGPVGCGKTTLAQIIAMGINCLNGAPNLEPCGVCRSCQEMIKGTHTDVRYQNASEVGGKADLSELARLATYMPQTNMRIFILDEAHGMSEAAQESMLAAFENPPLFSKYILCTSKPEKLLDSVRSRCGSRIVVASPSEDQCISILQRVLEGEGQKQLSLNIGLLSAFCMAAKNVPRDVIHGWSNARGYINGRVGTPSDAEVIELMAEYLRQNPEVSLWEDVVGFLFTVIEGATKAALDVALAQKNISLFVEQAGSLLAGMIQANAGHRSKSAAVNEFLDGLTKMGMMISTEEASRYIEVMQTCLSYSNRSVQLTLMASELIKVSTQFRKNVTANGNQHTVADVTPAH